VGATIALPTSVSGSNKRLVLSAPGSSSGADSEGGLSLSENGKYVVLAGYDAATGGATVVSGTTSSATNRIAALIDASSSGSVDTTTRFTGGFSANNVRGATTSDGSKFWATGAGSSTKGVWYVGHGLSNDVQLNSSIAMTWCNIFSGQLYGDSAKGPNVFTIGTGEPSSGSPTATSLPANYPNSGTGQTPMGFVFLDLNTSVAGLDTLYVADELAGGIKKWTWNGATWSQSSTSFTSVTGIGTINFRGLAAVVVGSDVNLIAGTSTATGADQYGSTHIVKFVDDGSASPTGTVIVTAPTNELYKGIAMSPHL
jgi:hypothetical protein